MGSKYEKSTTITNFFKHKSILITGATGFLGTALLVKLLTSCPDVKNIYVIIKTRKGLVATERLKQHVKTEPFQSIHERNPAVLDKIVPISGDMLAPDFGLNELDMEILRANVEIVFHAAANVHFEMSIVDAVNSNTIPTGKLLQFCRSFSNLLAFIYVSTAFCACKNNGDVIEEKVYQTRTSWQAALYVIDAKSDNKRIMDSLIEGRPNVYAYSKALAEQLIESEYRDLPVAIVRPSVVLGAQKEPVAGWVHGFSQANNVLLLQGMGLLRVWYQEKDVVLDIVPVDYVVNNLIAVAWDVSANRVNNGNEIKVFNCCSVLRNPLLMGRMMDMSSRYSCIQYKDEHLLPPTLITTNSSIKFAIVFFILYTIPAYILHWLSVITCQKSGSLKWYSQLKKLLHHSVFFTTNHFTFIDHNVKELYLKMDPEDQIIFDFNITHVNWDKFFVSCVYGLKKYLRHRILRKK